MKVAVRYYTRGGNTKKLADAIAKEFDVTAEDVSVALEEKTDVVFLGSALYAGGIDPSVKAFIRDNAANVGRIANFSSSASGKTTLKRVKAVAEENGVQVADEEFFCFGKFLFMHRGRPNERDLQNVAAFAKKTVENLEN